MPSRTSEKLPPTRSATVLEDGVASSAAATSKLPPVAEIAALKAVGYTNREIATHYLWLVAIVMVPGALLGVLVPVVCGCSRHLQAAPEADAARPVVEPQVSHFRQVPLRTKVKLAHSGQASPT